MRVIKRVKQKEGLTLVIPHNNSINRKGVVAMCGITLDSASNIMTKDGVIIMNSNTKCDLRNSNIKLIRICGHSSADSQTIGGYTLNNIAKFLVDNCNYRGNQTIELLCCESNIPCSNNSSKHLKCLGYVGKTLSENLERELYGLLFKPCKVVSECTGNSLILPNSKSKDKFDLYTIEYVTKLDRYILTLYTAYQNISTKKHVVEINNNDNNKDYLDFKLRIDKYNIEKARSYKMRLLRNCTMVYESSIFLVLSFLLSCPLSVFLATLLAWLNINLKVLFICLIVLCIVKRLLLIYRYRGSIITITKGDNASVLFLLLNAMYYSLWLSLMLNILVPMLIKLTY